MRIRELLHEPLVHFFALAAVLFLINEVASSTQKTRIVIDQKTAEFLIRQREDLELRVLSEAERADTISAFVEDEILYNEAYVRGLDRGDSRMRRNLILKMRGLLSGDVGEPTEEELRAYFESNRSRFSRPASLSLAQVFFDDQTAVPADLREQLGAGLDPATVGTDSLQFRRSMPTMTRRYIVGTFGSDVARAIVAIDDDAWHGPFESAQGVHFVRVVERHPDVQADFESVERYLQGDWLMDRSRAAIRAEVERVRPDYDIVIERDS